jgi:hypothetical protein
MDQQKPQIPSPPVNETRRRLTQGGLAAPVVLATLKSANALAGSTAYHCTISGKLSNNASHPGSKKCSSLGKSCDGWKQSTWVVHKKGSCQKSWNDYVYKDPKNNSDPWKMGKCMKDVESANGTKIKKYYCRKYVNGAWKAAKWDNTPDCVHMTLLEVAHLDSASGNVFDVAFAKEAVAAILNAFECAPNFPLTPDQCIAMFNATCDGGRYPVNDVVTWGKTEVCNYWSSLHA